MNRNLPCFLLLSGLVLRAVCFPAQAVDQPQWGQAWSRNLVSDERGLPDSFDPQTGRNIQWAAELGTETHSTPIVAGGRVYLGTNNGHPRDPAQQGDRGVLMCFDEKTGRFLWQLVFPKRNEDIYFDWPNSGISSPVTVEDDRVYFVNNRGVVLCLKVGPAGGKSGERPSSGAAMSASRKALEPSNALREARSAAPEDGRTPAPPEAGLLEPQVVWEFDLTSGAGIWSHDAAHSSILIHGDHLYLNSGTGVDNTHKCIRTPDAPSLVVLEKRTGRFVACDGEHIAPRIFHSTWSPPSLAEVNGKPLVFFAAGDGVVYAFETVRNVVVEHRNNGVMANNYSPQQSGTSILRPPASLRRVWQFDFDPSSPKTNVHRYNSNRRESPSNFFGMPVFDDNRIYVAGGGDIWWGKNEAWLKCIDATRTGDVTANGLVWSYPLQKHVMSTPAIWRGLAFIADCGRKFHCVDAQTGTPYWTHEIKGEAWASPLAADGKVYLGTRSGSFYVFAASKVKQVMSTIELGRPVSATAVAANGVLYVATMTHLYAVKQGAGPQ
jgi:outer membrane protein assembly factor BamB